jgi:F-type H+-transporting ATPase subunit a
MDRTKLISRIITAIFLVFSTSFFACAQHEDPHHTTDTTNDHQTEVHATTENAHGQTAGHDDEKFDVMHHIADDYSFPIAGNYKVFLPVIIMDGGLDVFLSSELYHPDPTTGLVRGKYYYEHGKLFIPELKDGKIQYDEKGHPIGKHSAKITDIGSSHAFYDISITKNTFGLFLSVALMLLIFISCARAYKKRGTDSAPKGLQNAMEAIILFVKNDIAIPFIGEKKHAKFLPYLLTVFFFIWINNMLGLIPIFPGSANVSGNIAFTFTLALLSLILVFIFGNKHFWGHILWYPGVNVPLKIFLAVLELVGVFSKPFALMIRLFANISAGHILIMSIIGMTFMVKSMAGGIGIGVVTSLFSSLMFILELLVAAIQAYIFTLLTAQMIGAAVEEPHHHKAGHTEEAHH